MAAYEREVVFKSEPWEYVLLKLNGISNNHGLSWARGLRFTILVALAFYFFYLSTLERLPFSWGWKGIESYLHAAGETTKYFFRFFVVTHDFDFMEKYGPTAGSFLVDLLAKIFIGFGIYQTIQAFRKFGKS
jgi:hypothetical protein